ncbi:hypothetical protein TNCV_1545061 [Trichonephila clavipes]|nr:hypothetical protein TNCV_1545061 [Trichonephila clavipes]
MNARETTDRLSRSHPPRCTRAHDDRRIVRMEVMDHATDRRQIQPITHHSVSAHTIPRRVESPRAIHRFVYPCLDTTGVCAVNDAMNSGHGQWKELHCGY